MTELEQRFSGGKVPARSLSDGTLRFLTLGVLNEDPEFHGLVCIEEPENGSHPSKMEELVDLLKDMTVDTTFAPSWEDANLMRQVIMATHSPYLVQLLSKEDILFTLKPMRRGGGGQSANTIECWPLRGTWRDGQDGNASNPPACSPTTSPIVSRSGSSISIARPKIDAAMPPIIAPPGPANVPPTNEPICREQEVDTFSSLHDTNTIY